MRFSADRLSRQMDEVFRSWGMIETYRRDCVDRITESDLMGIDSHGIGMLPLYEQYRRRGCLVINPEVTVVSDHHAVALVDAAHGMGHIAATRAMELAIDKAAHFGVGVVSVCRSNHYGAAGAYSNMALAKRPARTEYDRNDPALGRPDVRPRAPLFHQPPGFCRPRRRDGRFFPGHGHQHRRDREAHDRQVGRGIDPRRLGAG